VHNYPEEIAKLHRASNRLTNDGRAYGPPHLMHKLFTRRERLRLAAAKEFARLNHWRLSKPFSAGALAHSERCWRDALDQLIDQGLRFPHPLGRDLLFDHCIYFRWRFYPYPPAAIVTEPYNRTLQAAQRIAAEAGLRVHAAPNQDAGFWYPGRTKFYCITHPGTQQVRFLKAQQLLS
jgi:hypothetical protein